MGEDATAGSPECMVPFTVIPREKAGHPVVPARASQPKECQFSTSVLLDRALPAFAGTCFADDDNRKCGGSDRRTGCSLFNVSRLRLSRRSVPLARHMRKRRG